MAARQIRRLLSASWRARRTVPSVSASLRLAASSLLIVRRGDITFIGFATGLTATVGTSGVLAEFMTLFLSYLNKYKCRRNFSGSLQTIFEVHRDRIIVLQITIEK
jgi:hypothetical protein